MMSDLSDGVLIIYTNPKILFNVFLLSLYCALMNIVACVQMICKTATQFFTQCLITLISIKDSYIHVFTTTRK